MKRTLVLYYFKLKIEFNNLSSILQILSKIRNINSILQYSSNHHTLFEKSTMLKKFQSIFGFMACDHQNNSDFQILSKC